MTHSIYRSKCKSPNHMDALTHDKRKSYRKGVKSFSSFRPAKEFWESSNSFSESLSLGCVSEKHLLMMYFTAGYIVVTLFLTCTLLICGLYLWTLTFIALSLYHFCYYMNELVSEHVCICMWSLVTQSLDHLIEHLRSLHLIPWWILSEWKCIGLSTIY